MTEELTTVPKNPGEALCLRFRSDIENALNYELVTGALAFMPFMAAVKQDVLNNKRLAEAFATSPQTAINALMLAAQCKLLPGSAYDFVYLIPRSNKGRLEVQPMIGYKGMCELAKRHPRVHKVEAFLVYKGERFAFNPGQGKLDHEFGLDVDRSDENIIAAYAKVVITDPAGHHPVLDDPVVWVMTRAEIEKSMRRSDAWKGAERNGSKSSPWHTDFPMMARKTVLRAVLTKGSVPKDMGVGGLLHKDDEADLHKPPELPAAPQGTSIRSMLGIEDGPEEFGCAEEAVAAIKAAKSEEALRNLAAGWQHFHGLDAETIAEAYEDRMAELEERK